jgi:holo-[acyl-carrier protein] synthase
MAVCGVGVDIVRVARVKRVLLTHGQAFVDRILTPEEQRGEDKPLTPATLAKRWAAKEAVAKALGTGIGSTYSFHDIQLAHTPAGAPLAQVRGVTGRIWLSVADEAVYAVATAVWEVD